MRLAGLVAPKKLRNVVHTIHEHVDIAVIIEIAECAAAAGDCGGDAGAAAGTYVREAAVAKIAIQVFVFGVGRFVFTLFTSG